MQIRCEQKPIITWSRAFYRAMHSHWFIVLLPVIVRDHLFWVYDGQVLKNSTTSFSFFIATRTAYNTSYKI